MSMSRLEAVLASIDAAADRSQAKLDQAAEFATRSEQLRVEGSSGDGSVRVQVNSTGQPAGVDFESGFERLSAEELGAAVMAALGEAQRRLTTEIGQLGSEIYGEGSSTAAMFTESYRERYGEEER